MEKISIGLPVKTPHQPLHRLDGESYGGCHQQSNQGEQVMNNGYKDKSSINKTWRKVTRKNSPRNIPEIVKYYKDSKVKNRKLKTKLMNELPMKKAFLMKLFQPSKYGSVKKITDYGNTEFVENYLSDWLDKQ